MSENRRALLNAENFDSVAESLYREEYAESLVEYFDRQPFNKVVRTEYDKTGAVKSEKEEYVAVDYPTFERFAAHLGVSCRVLEMWRNKYEAFDRAMIMAQELQRGLLLTLAMSGDYNGTMAKLELLAHGYVEGNKGEVEYTLEILEGDG